MKSGGANLEPPSASEAGYKRPVLIVQSNELNDSRDPTVIVVPLTSNTRFAGLTGNVLFRDGTAGLTRDSVVVVRQLLAVDRKRLLSVVGNVPDDKMMEVDQGLRDVLDPSLFPDD